MAGHPEEGAKLAAQPWSISGFDDFHPSLIEVYREAIQDSKVLTQLSSFMVYGKEAKIFEVLEVAYQTSRAYHAAEAPQNHVGIPCNSLAEFISKNGVAIFETSFRKVIGHRAEEGHWIDGDWTQMKRSMKLRWKKVKISGIAFRWVLS